MTDAVQGGSKELGQKIQDLFDWMFRSRRTGRVTVIQVPNALLIVWFLASVGHRFFDGAMAGGLALVATLALTAWAVLEVVTGVNPFRRLVGLVVLVWVVVSRLLIG